MDNGFRPRNLHQFFLKTLASVPRGLFSTKGGPQERGQRQVGARKPVGLNSNEQRKQTYSEM